VLEGLGANFWLATGRCVRALLALRRPLFVCPPWMNFDACNALRPPFARHPKMIVGRRLPCVRASPAAVSLAGRGFWCRALQAARVPANASMKNRLCHSLAAFRSSLRPLIVGAVL